MNDAGQGIEVMRTNGPSKPEKYFPFWIPVLILVGAHLVILVLFGVLVELDVSADAPIMMVLSLLLSLISIAIFVMLIVAIVSSMSLYKRKHPERTMKNAPLRNLDATGDVSSSDVRAPKRLAHGKVRFVQVKHCDFDRQPFDDAMVYTYRWPHQVAPEIGMRVWSPYDTGAIIVGLGKGHVPPGVEIIDIGRLPTQVELEKASVLWEARHGDPDEMLQVARKVVGLPAIKGGTRKRTHPLVPPLANSASRGLADDYGKRWWFIFRRAQEAGYPDEEVKMFKRAAQDWFLLRDGQI